jgi:hypothetical protein
MPLFVRTELAQLANEAWRGQSRDGYLRRIDVDRAMLTRVVHLDDAIAERFELSERCRQCSLRLCAVRLANRIERSIAETGLPKYL